MSQKSYWTKEMLQRLQALTGQGLDVHAITDIIFEEFDGPTTFGEIKREVAFLNTGPKENLWTTPMVNRLRQLHAEGKDVHSITDTLFEEFGEPRRWQETYRKLQQLKLSA